MTEEKRIKIKIGVLVGLTLVALIAMVMVWSFVLIRPQKENIKKAEQQNSDEETVAKRLPEAYASEQKSEDKKKYLKAQIDFFRGSDDVNDKNRFNEDKSRFRRFFFDFGTNLATDDLKRQRKQETWERLLNEYYSNYGLELKHELMDIADRAGVVINTSIKVEAPPKHPEDMTVPTNGFIRPVSGGNGVMGSVTVTGTLSNILQFFSIINEAKILMVIGNVKLENTSPNTKATFSITPYLMAAGPDAPITAGGSVGGGPAAGGPGAAGGPPGAGGGPPAGANAAAPKGKGGASSDDEGGGGGKKGKKGGSDE